MSTILVVDDDSALREMLCEALRRSGHLVLQAQNGKEALVICSCENVIDVVLTDLVMPEVEGVELIVRLRGKHPSMKFIAMSGGGANEPETYLAITRQLGAHKTLAKPFSLEEMDEAIRTVQAASGTS